MPGLLTGLGLLLHEGVDTRLVWLRLWATPRRTLGLIFGTAAAAVVVSGFVPRWYQSGATLVLDPGPQTNLGGAAGAGGVLGLATQLGFGSGIGPANPLFYEALLKSRSLQERVTTAQFPLGARGELETLEQYWSRKQHPTAREHLGAVRKLARHFETSATPRTLQVAFK